MVLFAPRTGKIPQLGDAVFVGFTGVHVSIKDSTVTVVWNKTKADFRGELWRNCRLNWKREKAARRLKRLGLR